MERENEIDEILDSLKEYWKEHPYLRLGQVISIISKKEFKNDDPFYMNDDYIKNFLDKNNQN